MNKTLARPELMDLVSAVKSDVMKTMNCVKIGKIEGFDVAKKTAKIQILFKINRQGSAASYPLVVDCPVFTLQGGGACVQMPIKVGDTCLVLFADRDIDEWFRSGSEAVPASNRVHDLSDGIALIGLNSENSDLSDYSADEARMTHEDAKFGLKGGKATVQNSTVSLLQVLTDLITGIQGAACASPGSPLVDTTTKIATAMTELNSLLYED